MADVTDFFKRAFFATLGMAAVGKEKMEEFAKEYASFYNKTEEEGRKFYEDLVEEAKKTKEDIEKNIKETSERIADRFNQGLKARLDALEARVTQLEMKVELDPDSAKLESLEARLSQLETRFEGSGNA